MRVAMCPAGLHGEYEQSLAVLYSLRPLNRHD